MAEDVTELENVQLVHLDHLSQMTDETLERRKQFIPQAEKIIVEIEGEFNQWLETRKFAPTIKALKKKIAIDERCGNGFSAQKDRRFQ